MSSWLKVLVVVGGWWVVGVGAAKAYGIVTESDPVFTHFPLGFPFPPQASISLFLILMSILPYQKCAFADNRHLLLHPLLPEAEDADVDESIIFLLQK